MASQVPDDELPHDGFTALACAVLHQAIVDAKRDDYLGAEARDFLKNGNGCLWTELIGTDGDVLAARLHRQP